MKRYSKSNTSMRTHPPVSPLENNDPQNREILNASQGKKNEKRKTIIHHFISAGVNACTTLVPSIKRVLKIRFAFVNMPSFRLTTMNWLPRKRVRIRRPMFCVCDRSRAASTSSRMYMGAGEYCSRERIRERAMRDLD